MEAENMEGKCAVRMEREQIWITEAFYRDTGMKHIKGNRIGKLK